MCNKNKMYQTKVMYGCFGRLHGANTLFVVFLYITLTDDPTNSVIALKDTD